MLYIQTTNVRHIAFVCGHKDTTIFVITKIVIYFVSKILILLLCTSTILIYDLTIYDLRLIKLRSFHHKSDVFSIVNRKQSNRKYE